MEEDNSSESDAKRIQITIDSIIQNLIECQKKEVDTDKFCIIIYVDGNNLVKSHLREYFVDNGLIGKSNEYSVYSEYNPSDFSLYDLNLIHTFQIRKNMLNENQNLKMNIILAIKQVPQGQLFSHFTIFGGFCQFIKPQIVVLLDAGLQFENKETLLGTCYNFFNNILKTVAVFGQVKPLKKELCDLKSISQSYKDVNLQTNLQLQHSSGFIFDYDFKFSAFE